MATSIAILFVIFFCVRLYTLIISIRNEKILKQQGAREYGKANSLILALLHVLFYVGAFTEGYMKQVQFDQVTVIGLAIYVLAIAALFYVIKQLSPIWTVKLIIGDKHPLNNGFIFKTIRHPNYFLNIIPELIGLALVMKAYVVLTALFPVYLVSLAVRIVQEEKVMRARFSGY